TQIAAIRDEMQRTQAELLEAQEQAAAGSASGDLGEVEFAQAETRLLRELVDAGAEAVNGEVSRLRRNSEILRGYIEDFGRIASFVSALNGSSLPPDDNEKLQALMDEVSPSDVHVQMQGVADENADAASHS